MSDALSQILTLMTDVILPKLESIHSSQMEQQRESDRLHLSLDEFRQEMQIRFAALHAEIAACRQELEDTLVTMRERDAGDGESGKTFRKRLIH